MEEAWTILEYLPLSFKSEKDQEYIDFLWQTFQTNYEAGKYQFAYLAYHMLFMSYVYFIVWRIRTNQPEDFQKALVGFQNDQEKELLEASSPFVFHKINESVIFRFLKLLGCDKTKIGNYTKMVKDRNEVAHSNGNIFYSVQTSIDEKISAMLKLIEEIQLHSKPVVLNCYIKFLLENYNSETREYPDAKDQIKEILVQKNFFSQKDIEICLTYNLDNLSSETDFEEIEKLEEVFVELYVGEVGGGG